MDDDGLTTQERLYQWLVMQVQTMINCREAGKPIPRDAEGQVVPDVRFEDCTPVAKEFAEKKLRELE